MKIALIGLPQVGKKTLFSLMTGVPYDQLISRAGDYAVGMVKVTDPRIDKLSALYKPKKTKYAEIECTLAPGSAQGCEAARAMARQAERHGRALSRRACVRRRSGVPRERLCRSAARHRSDEPRAGDHRSQPRGVAPRAHRAGAEKEGRRRERRRGGAAADAQALPGERQITARAPDAGSRAEEDSLAAVSDAQGHGDGAQLRRVELSQSAVARRGPDQNHRSGQRGLRSVRESRGRSRADRRIPPSVPSSWRRSASKSPPSTS